MDSGQTQCDAASDRVSAPAEPLVSTVQLLLADSKLLHMSLIFASRSSQTALTCARRLSCLSLQGPVRSFFSFAAASTRWSEEQAQAPLVQTDIPARIDPCGLAHRTPGADAVNMAADARNTWRARPASVRAVATDTKPALRASGAATEPCALAPGRGRGRKDPLARTSCLGPGRGHRHTTRAACLPSSYGALRACSGPWPRTQESLGAHVLLRSGPWPQTRNPRRVPPEQLRNLARLLRAVAADARIPWRASVRAVATDTKPAVRASRAAMPGALGRARCCKICLARSSCWSRPWPALGCGRGRKLYPGPWPQVLRSYAKADPCMPFVPRNCCGNT